LAPDYCCKKILAMHERNLLIAMIVGIVIPMASPMILLGETLK